MAEAGAPAKKRKLSDESQHIVLTDDQLDNKLATGKNINTEKSEKRAHKAFTNFLKQNGASDLDYWLYEEPELDRYLAKFWLGCRKVNTDEASDNEQDTDKKESLYSANTLKNFRYSLNRILRSKGHLYDITVKGTSFMKSDEAFKVAQKELKQEGKAEVKSHPEITEDGKENLTFHDRNL